MKEELKKLLDSNIQKALASNPDSDASVITENVMDGIVKALETSDADQKTTNEDAEKEINKLVEEKVTEAIAKAKADEAHQASVDASVKKALEEYAPAGRGSNFVSPGGPAIIKSRGDKGDVFSLSKMLFAIAKGNEDLAPYEMEVMKNDLMDNPYYFHPSEGRSINKDMGTTPATAGGYIVPTEQSTRIIDALSSKSFIRRLNPTIMPMASDTMTIPTETGSPTPETGRENVAATESEATLGQKVLIAKELVTIVPVSNQLLADSNPAVDKFLERIISREMAKLEDKQFLFGSGVGTEILGILNNAGVNEEGTTTLAALTFDEIIDTIGAVEDADAEPDFTATTPLVKRTLRKIKDNEDRPIWDVDQSVATKNVLYGLPLSISTHCTRSEGGDDVLLAGMAEDIIIGQRMQMQIDASEHVGFKERQTFIRATLRVDMVLAHEESFSFIRLT